MNKPTTKSGVNVFNSPAGLPNANQLVEMTFLGTGFGDRLNAFRGGSKRFKEGVRRPEVLAELQGERASKRCSSAVQRDGSTVRVRQTALKTCKSQVRVVSAELRVRRGSRVGADF